MERKQAIFIFYAEEDEVMFHDLMKHLGLLEQKKEINIWNIFSLGAGVEKHHAIDIYLNAADLILILVSPDFMNSEYAYGIEMEHAMQRQRQGEAQVMPVILRPVHWQEAVFGKLPAVPAGGVPVTDEQWHDLDTAFYNVFLEIKRVLTVASPQKKEHGQAVRSRRRLHPGIRKHIPALKHRNRRIPRLFMSLATVILLLLLSLMALFQTRWCPAFFCSVSQDMDHVSDQNLDVRFSSQESTFFELPGALRQYSLQNLPRTIAAVRSDTPSPGTDRFLINLKNLHQSGYDIYIDAIELLVQHVPPLADPLNVWDAGSLSSSAILYTVNYAGEPPGSILGATLDAHQYVKGSYETLNPGETDSIAVEVDPVYSLRADVQFQIRIAYRMTNESQKHTLILPEVFEVVFSTADNWHVHQF